MREVKTHWRGRKRAVWNGIPPVDVSICGVEGVTFAGNHKGVTCLRCKRLLAGYQGEKK
jgi:hypothetical protein